MNKKQSAIAFIGIAAIIIAAVLVFYPKEKTYSQLDSFAKCLASKGITMYGADWCPHCQDEKNRFGSSFRFVPYIECPDEPDKCIAAGINGYPTWTFPASPAGGPDGRKLEGEQGLDRLSSESGCPLKVRD
ncbi:MAG: hypothetical protein HY432_01480 [Candidatus Liptonbacteria bacterium]|nr:hypothetical protein [Candidatus Liptonbacteria bacterium]